ncbi:MAG: tripartite tricarboxylate transporter TctB family protein [Microvirga sp.]|nr:tripartite tricarboxylate transporter TctB family protein [Microvirga sp.]
MTLESPVEREARPSLDATPASRIYNDYTLAALIIFVCALAYYFSTWIEHVPAGLAQGIQPASFPQGVIVVALLLTLLMLFESRKDPLEVPETVPGLAYQTMAAMLAALIVATWFDFFFAMIVFVALCVPLWGMRRWVKAVLFAVALNLVMYLLFSTFLRVRFPQGALTGLLS